MSKPAGTPPTSKLTSKPAGKIDELRGLIDEIDQKLLRLLEKRAALAQAIGHEKRKGQAAPASQLGFYDPEREERVLARLDQLSEGPFPRNAIRFVFKEVMSACRSLEYPLKVAYLGPEGTYSQMAAVRAFGKAVSYLEVPTIEGVFDAVTRQQADYGVVPIENSYGGGVLQTLDALVGSDLEIGQEVLIPVDHCLLSMESGLSSIRRVYSHPQALAQAKRWLATHLPGVELIESRSTAAAAATAQSEKGAAAISSRLSAEKLGIPILFEAIQDQRDNATRFAVLAVAEPRGKLAAKQVSSSSGHKAVPAQAKGSPGRNQISLCVRLRPQGSGIAQVLGALAASKVEVRRVESRATRDRKWDYYFFLDLVGHPSERRVALALKKLARLCEEVKLLGSYRSAK